MNSYGQAFLVATRYAETGNILVCIRQKGLGNFTSTPITRIRMLILYFRMATELNVTQNLSKMTLDLSADTVNVQVVVKTLKGQYGVC